MFHRSSLLPFSFVFLFGCGSDAQVPPPEVGDVAPAFTLKQVATQEDFDSESLKGSIVVLNFWGVTCPVCMKEIGELKEIQSAGKVKVVGIAIDGDADKITKIMEAKGINYPILAGGEEIFTRFDGYSIPYTLVLDKSMVVRKKVSGRLEKADFEKLIDEI
ncbi:MAG: TlpA disulfide reductase family protein [Planctomycetota bacterium]|nr:TlpA disulfide reductase family protein [Planctomycetota bacterium]